MIDDIKKEPKFNDPIDVNSTVNNMLEKITDAISNPEKANLKTLRDIRDYLIDLKKVDKTSRFSILPEIREKIEKINKQITSDIPNRTKKYDDINNKKINEIDNNNLDKTIKVLNEAMSVIEGTEKLSESITLPESVSSKVMVDIVFSLLAKQVKQYYEFLFPEKDSKLKEEIDITPPSQQKIKQNINQVEKEIKEENITPEIEFQINKNNEELNIRTIKNEKNINLNPDPEKTNKQIFNLNDFPDFSIKGNNSISDDIINTNINKEIKEENELTESEEGQVKGSLENKILEEDLDKNEKLDNLIEQPNVFRKEQVDIENIDKESEKNNNEVGILNLDSIKEKQEINTPIHEDEKNVNEINNVEFSEKNQESIESNLDKSEKENIEIENMNPIEKNIIETDIFIDKQNKNIDSPTIFQNLNDDINNPAIVDNSVEPEEKEQKDLNELTLETTKIEKNISDKIRPSNLLTQTAELIGRLQEDFGGAEPGTQQALRDSVASSIDQPLVSVLVDLLFSATLSFRYAKEFTTQFIAAQIQTGISKVELYRSLRENLKESLLGPGFWPGRPTSELSDAIDNIEDRRNSGEPSSVTDYTKRSFLEHTLISGDIADGLIKPNLEDERQNKEFKDSYHKNRGYLLNDLTEHPQSVGFLKIYTKRSMKFDNSQTDIQYLPMQFEPKISGDGKSASYSQITTLARSGSAQVYRNSSERKLSLELEYLITGPADDFDGFGDASEKGNSISSMGMKEWTENYIYNYLYRNFRNLDLPNMSDPKYKLGPPIVQVWYGGIEGSSASSTGVNDSTNEALGNIHPAFRTNWYTLNSNGEYQYHTMRSLWLCESVNFEFKGGIINAEARRTQGLMVSLSLVEIAPSVTDNELMIWAPIVR
jgi:hypothetical protein